MNACKWYANTALNDATAEWDDPQNATEEKSKTLNINSPTSPTTIAHRNYTFDAIKQTDDEGKEWWNSRDLAKELEYAKYWNFERLIEKIGSALQIEKGLNPAEHIREIHEMAQLENGAHKKVTSILLSRTVCITLVSNADKKKPLVKIASEYFQSNLTTTEISKGREPNILLYHSTKGKVNVAVMFNQDTFWLSQKQMAELFGTAVSTINYHLKQIEEAGDIQMSDAVRKFRIPLEQWTAQGVLLYNLDVVIAVGYRVNSYEATQFRIWATSVLKEYLKEYIVKGFALDDEQLKSDNAFGKDYFEELIERIPEIRTSERRYYQKITDIYTECSSDYDKVTNAFLGQPKSNGLSEVWKNSSRIKYGKIVNMKYSMNLIK